MEFAEVSITGMAAKNNKLFFKVESNYKIFFYSLEHLDMTFANTKDMMWFTYKDVSVKNEKKQIVLAVPCDLYYLENNRSINVNIDFGRISVVSTINIENNDGQIKFSIAKQICSRQF